MLRRIGPNIKTWRIAQRMTASHVAERAGITRATLRTIETDPGSVSFRNIMAVLAVLGADDLISEAFDPAQSARGQAILIAAASNRQTRG